MEDFKASLDKIKKDALDSRGTSTAGNTGAASKPRKTEPTEKTATTSDTGQAISEPAATENTSKAGHKDGLAWTLKPSCGFGRTRIGVYGI